MPSGREGGRLLPNWRWGDALDREIAALAIPAFATLLTEPLYLLCDTAIVGHLGNSALAALAIANTIILFAYAVFVFLTFTTAASVAQDAGAGRHDHADHTTVQSLWLGLGLGLALTVVGWVLAPLAVSAFGPSAHTAALATWYLRVSSLGFPALLVSMAASGALRGRRDTRSPLLAAAVGSVVNLVFEAVAIFWMGFGIGASALGTTIAQFLAAAILVARLRPHLGHVSWRPHAGAIARQGRAGGDLILRTFVLRAVLAVAVWWAGRGGERVQAAYQIAIGIWIFLAFGLDALEAAAHVLVGEAVGARDAQRTRAVSRRVIARATQLGAVLGGLTLLGHGVLARGFTPDSRTVAVAAGGLLWVGAMQPVCGAAFAIDGVLVASGRTRAMAGAMAGAGVVFGAVLVPSLRWDGVSVTTALWIALTLFMVVRAGLGLLAANDVVSGTVTRWPDRA